MTWRGRSIMRQPGLPLRCMKEETSFRINALMTAKLLLLLLVVVVLVVMVMEVVLLVSLMMRRMVVFIVMILMMSMMVMLMMVMLAMSFRTTPCYVLSRCVKGLLVSP